VRPQLSATQLGDLCAQAESAGAGALWALDHLFWAVPILECFTTLTVAAGATASIPIGSCVLQLPLRQPAAVAKQAAALQFLSSGRLILGLGVGSHPGEYEAAGVDFSTRGIALDQGMETLRRCWQPPEAAGPYRQVPSPAAIPLWIGGSSAPAIKRAGRAGDGWIPLFLSPPEYRTGLSQVRLEAERSGRQGEVFPAVVVMAVVGPKDRALEEGSRFLSTLYSLPAKAFSRHLVAGPADEVAEGIGRYLDVGAEHVAVMICHDQALEQFAALVEALGERAQPVTREMVPA
jgi:alkanesulfonate monooxygenase SsuD/methylene tetrahydromethanopterin reductase-like flavin-dependent oxidoreductase (luciferase family)